ERRDGEPERGFGCVHFGRGRGRCDGRHRADPGGRIDRTQGVGDPLAHACDEPFHPPLWWPKEPMQAVGVPWGASPRHTEELAMTSAPILAVDLGKYKCVACAYGRAAAAAEFHTVTTSRAELARLIGRLRPAVVVIEACSLAGWVHDL